MWVFLIMIFQILHDLHFINRFIFDHKKYLINRDYRLYVHGSVHRNINLIERTNKMQPCSRIYYSSVS